MSEGIIKYLKRKKELKKIIKLTKKQFRIIINELTLYNKDDDYPKYVTVKLIDYGLELRFSISGICDFERINNNLNFIRDAFKAKDILAINESGRVILKIYLKELQDLTYEKILLPPTTLLIGYNYDSIITIDMLKLPHLLISGLSNSGKSCCLNYILKNVKADNVNITILNAYKNDYPGFTIINNIKEIELYLKNILSAGIQDKTTYIVIEEMQILNNSKSVSSLCKEVLSYGRHLNVYVIGVIQNANKNSCIFKDLFNNRLSFRQIDSSSFLVALGTSTGLNKNLKQREFYLIAENGLINGKAFINH